jgi:hypothetical protein
MNKRFMPSPPNHIIHPTINIHRNILIMNQYTTAFGRKAKERRKRGGINVVAQSPREVCAGKTRRGLSSLSFWVMIIVLTNAWLRG